MRVRGLVAWTAAGAAMALAASCTLDFATFEYEANASATAASSASSGSSGGGPGSGGAAASSTTASSAASGGAGGDGGSTMTGGNGGTAGSGGGVVEVACPSAPCDVSSGGVCCLPLLGQTGQCLPSGNCMLTETSVTCDGPEDCPGEICCGTFSGGNYTVLECSPTCNGQGNVIVCDSAGPNQCMGNANCVPSNFLPPGYEVCI